MDIKEFLAMVLLFTMVFIGLACMTSTVHGADVNIQRDFDNVTIYHAEKSDSSSQAVYGLENNAKLIGRDRVNHTEPVSTMKNTVVESDTGYYTYQYLTDEDGNQLNPTDRVKFNYNRTLTAIYGFTPYMNAEIDVIDLHGHSGSSSTYPAMKHETDSITKTFKPFTDVETGYTPLYILDLDTNMKYQPGDKFTITYTDVLSTGLNRIIKTFQYVYAKDIVVENIIVENRTVYNDTVVDRVIYNDTIIDRTIYNDTIINREVYNDTIINRIIYNDTIIDRIIYNDTVVDRIIYNDTIINREVYNDVIINRTIYNDTIVDRIIYNDTIVERIIFNDTVIDRVIFNDTVIDRVIFNDTIVNRTIYNDTIINRTIENITFVNKTIEVPVYVNKTIEVPFYKIIVIPEIIIDNPVIPISNNNNTSQYNETNTDKILNNNTTNTNNVTSNINKENNNDTYISSNTKTITMKKTGNDTFGIVLLIILFIILIQLYRREDEK